MPRQGRGALHNRNSENRDVPAENARNELKELVTKETVVGKKTYQVTMSDGTTVPQEFSILYGNILSPVLPDKGPKAMNVHAYKEMLNAFLDSPEGQGYRRPSEDEINEAISVVRKEISEYKKSKQMKAIAENNDTPQTQSVPSQPVQQEHKEQPPVQLTPAPAPVVTQQPQPDAQLQAQLFSVQQELLQQQRAYADSVNEITLQNQKIAGYEKLIREHADEASVAQTQIEKLKGQIKNLEEQLNEGSPIKEGRGGDIGLLKILSIVSLAVCLALAGMTGFMLWKNLNGAPAEEGSDLPQVFDGTGTMSINGQEYEIPLTNITIENGETKTVFYAVQTSLSEEGDVSADAYPIGTWVFKSADVQMEPSAEPSADTEKKE